MQFHSWQEDLEKGIVTALWPGQGTPQKRLHIVATMLQIAVADRAGLV